MKQNSRSKEEQEKIRCRTPQRLEHGLMNMRKENKMVTKELGKITFAEYGTIRDYPYYIGLQLGFRMNGSAVMDGGKYTVNISPECKMVENEPRRVYYEIC